MTLTDKRIRGQKRAARAANCAARPCVIEAASQGAPGRESDRRRPVARVAAARSGLADRRPENVSGALASWPLVAVEHSMDAIVLSDLDGTVRYVNAAFERQTGLSAAGVVGRPTWLLDPGELQAGPNPAMAEAVRRGETWSGDRTYRRADGTIAHLVATVAPVRDGSGTIVGIAPGGLERPRRIRRRSRSSGP